MNYWHIQLFPGSRKDEFDIFKIKEILITKSVIGIAAWKDGVRAKDDFYEKMQIGDVVVVKHGQKPVALVKVIGHPYDESDVNPNLDWFNLRRKIKVLDYYKEQYNFEMPQPRGTLNYCDDRTTKTSRIIIAWHQKYLKKQIMKASLLSDQRKEELRQLWQKFKVNNSEPSMGRVVKESERLLSEWFAYRAKILDDSFSLDDYTNRKRLKTANMPGGYLCNFLERDTSAYFGSSRPGNANFFGVKMNDDEVSYTLLKDLKKGDKQNINTKEVAEEEFNRTIKPLLKSVVTSANPQEQIQLIANCNYRAKQLLRKMAVLDRRNEYLYIYADAAIDPLYDEFVAADDTSNLAKNYAVRLVINEVLDVKDSIEENFLISRFLWLYTNTKGLADEDSPNVILYGPPGTGKTYSVKQSLDFLCQGDRDRYEFIQFHPSFTYEDFIEGIKPKGVSQDGNIRFELVDGVFKKFCKKAKANLDKDYYFVVDEINRANLSSVFGETLVCLEKDYRHDGTSEDNLFKTQYASLIEDMIKDDSSNETLAYHYINGNVYFGVPKNVFFIGMMNDVDRSIDAFDLALRRRFKWVRKDCDYDVIESEVKFRNGDDFKNILD